MNKYEEFIIETLQEFGGSCMLSSIQSKFHKKFINEDDLNIKIGSSLDNLIAINKIQPPNANPQLIVLR